MLRFMFCTLQSQLYPSYPAGFLLLHGGPANGTFNLSMAGLFGKGYILQATTNLTTWTSIQTNSPAADPNVALTTNIFTFTDAAATNFPRRFYRAIQQP